MSLYDGVSINEAQEKENRHGLDAAKIAGWSDSLHFMKTQLQLKKAVSKPSGVKGSRALTTSGPGNLTLASLTGTTDKQTIVVDEYNPLKPNDYFEVKERLKQKDESEKREKERVERREKKDDRDEERETDRSSHRLRDRDTDRERDRDRDRDRDRKDRDRDRGDRDQDKDRERSKTSRGGAAIAPPASLLTTPVDPNAIVKKDGAGTGGFSTGNVVASNIMAKYGWKEGQGLGREEQGLSTCLQVEKTSKRGGKIVNKDVEKLKTKPEFVPPSPPQAQPVSDGMEEEKKQSDITEMMRNPSKVVVLKNMVGPGEVDDDLQPEIEEECGTKYGEITKVIIFEIPGAKEDEAVRIFVEFKRMESAVKAIVDLNGRFFGGRVVSASFYNLDRFRRLDLAG